jgi:hypothetical protein
VVGLALGLPTVARARPDCATVLRKLHDVTGHNSARVADPVNLGRRLGVDPEWIERCAAAYGRTVKRQDEQHPQDKDNPLVEGLEEQEYEEVDREEKETQGDKYFTVIEEDERNRQRLRRFNADSSAEWEPFETHEWEPDTGREWEPFLLDDDHAMDLE